MPAATHQPAVDPLVALADRCVQCGLCLPACPTYGHDRLEAESPRGRIALARAWALETIAPTPVGDAHLDHCLGCRSCEAVCPAGVEYGALLVAVRGRQRERRQTGLRQSTIEALAARPRLLRGLLALYRRSFRALPQALRLLPPPPSPSGGRDAATAENSTSAGPTRDLTALFVGCVAGSYEPAVRSALARLCATLGVELDTPTGQTCCGSLHAHAGNLPQAARLAAINHDAFAGRTRVLTLASGCHETLSAAVDPPVVDALVFLDGHRERLHFAARRERIAVHLPCSQRNVVKSVPALRRLLAAVPGLEVIELDAGYGCCGAAGSQMLTDPARAAEYRHPLLEQAAASGATRVLSANLGCRLHLAGGTRIPVQHPIEFLAEANIADFPLASRR